MTKKCTKCRKIKPLSDFSKDSSRGDGLQATCKQCRKRYQTKYHQLNKIEVNKRHNRYNREHKAEIAIFRQTPEQKTKQKKYNDRRYQSNKEAICKQGNRYRQTEKGKITTMKKNARHRKLGSNFLNEKFPDGVGHHINDNDIVYIPGEIHRKFSTGPGYSEKHRDLILEYYGNVENMCKCKEVSISKERTSVLINEEVVVSAGGI
jgi:hypothetical protein